MFKNIVIPIDLSDKQSMKVIFPAALNFVTAFEAKLHLVHIIPDFGMKLIEDYLPRNWIKGQKEKYDQQIHDLIDQYVPEEIQAEVYIGKGAVYDEVINYADQVSADLIIVSAVRPQLKDYMLGPNASKIVRHSGISVLVMRT